MGQHASPQQKPTAGDRLAEPDPPRLGIIHLLVWTLCVAAYLGWLRLVITGTALGPLSGERLASWGFLGVAKGTALGGLVLMAVRRWRRLPFPVHPGEYLLVTIGLSVVVGWTFELVLAALAPVMAGPGDFFYMFGSWWWMRVFPAATIMILVYSWVLWRVKSLRWRLYFSLLLAGQVFYLARVPFGWQGPGRLALVARLLLIAFALRGSTLALITLIDHGQGKRYPWTHWTGVAVQLWLDVFWIGLSLWTALRPWVNR